VVRRGSPEALAQAIEQLVNAEPEHDWLWRIHDILHPDIPPAEDPTRLAVPSSVSVLLVDDSPTAGSSLQLVLDKTEGIEWKVEHAQTIELAKACLGRAAFEVLMVDWNMGQGRVGWELVRSVRGGHTMADPDQAVVLWTGHGLEALQGRPASDVAMINGAIPKTNDPNVLVMMIVPALAHAAAMRSRTAMLKGIETMVEGRMREVLAWSAVAS